MTSEKLCPFLLSLASVSYASVVTDIVIVAIHRQYTECSRLASQYNKLEPAGRRGLFGALTLLNPQASVAQASKVLRQAPF